MTLRTLSRPADADVRRDAAALLHQARHLQRGRRLDLARRAYEAVPQSRTARRAYVEALLDADRPAQAESIIAEGLLRCPTDPALTVLRALLLLRRGDLVEASRELQLALAARPAHATTLLLASAVAEERGDLDEAATLLSRATWARPHDEPLRERYVEVLIASGRIADAARELNGLGNGSAVLTARLLLTEDRTAEAAELLESALADRPNVDAAERLILELIPLLERLNERTRLRAVLESVPLDRPDALRPAAFAALGLGAFDEAARLAVRLAGSPEHRRSALHPLVVAAALGGRAGLARRALRRLEDLPEGIDGELMARCWQQGLAGRAIADPSSTAATSSGSVLRAMVRRARRALDHAVAEGPPEAIEQAELARHRAVCLAVLGKGTG